jgi:hypothetical protein|tara:strand:+ start:13706 stop:14257 length:552 start_codon:yes stop_codon:yes gene_type:complete
MYIKINNNTNNRNTTNYSNKMNGEIQNTFLKVPENLITKPMCNNNIYSNVLLDPHTPPVKNDTMFNNSNNLNNIKLMPVNVATQSVNTQYRQVGILTRVNEDDTILPLMGRPVIANRDKWNYYTMNDKNNMIKLPIIFRNKSCTNQQGCDSLYDGDTVYIQGYKDLFRVTLYDNNSLEYIPYL